MIHLPKQKKKDIRKGKMKITNKEQRKSINM